jgi:hypothetical protein
MIAFVLTLLPAAPPADLTRFIAVWLVVLLTLGLCIFVVYTVAPLMLYFIHSRLGETNELLRSIATTLQGPTVLGPLQKSSGPAGPSPELAVPTFRMLR